MSDTSFPASPCSGICQMDARRRYCMGCRRTLAEIAGWGSMDVTERRQVLAALDARGEEPLEIPTRNRQGLA